MPASLFNGYGSIVDYFSAFCFYRSRRKFLNHDVVMRGHHD